MSTITLAQPEVNNLIDEGLAEEFRHACGRIEEDDQARLLVVAAAGPYFSVGRQPLALPPSSPPDEKKADDIAGTHRPADNGVGSESIKSISDRLQRLRVADALAGLALPTLVVLNGDAIAHGLELALAGDLRIAAAPARFALSEPERLSFPWDGGTQRLARLIGPAWALDFALTRRMVDAPTALRLGLVNRVAPPEDLAQETNQLAEAILSAGPVAAQYVKEAIGQGMDLPLNQGLRLEADLSLILHSTADRAEGIASFKERRPPRFKGS